MKDLLEIQKKSYQWFIDTGIKEVLEDLFPVENFSGTLSLEFGDYHFDEPRYSIKESRDRETTFAAPLKIEVRLFNHETGEVKEVKVDGITGEYAFVTLEMTEEAYQKKADELGNIIHMIRVRF